MEVALLSSDVLISEAPSVVVLVSVVPPAVVLEFVAPPAATFAAVTATHASSYSAQVSSMLFNIETDL